MTQVAVVILAAGNGTRMKSKTQKVLHKVAGRPMLNHLVATVEELKPAKILIVRAPDQTVVEQVVQPHKTVIQEKQLGTGHAVAVTKKELKDFKGPVLIVYGDTPAIRKETLEEMIKECLSGAAVVVLGFKPEDPLKYGRLIIRHGHLEAIIEYKDATEEERKINMCNSGMMCLDGKHLFKFLEKIDNKNASGEYYLTDVVKIARDEGLLCSVVEGDPQELAGSNSRTELAYLESIIQKRLRQQVMDKGVTLIDPKTVFLSYDTIIGNDVTIEPYVFFGPGVEVKDDAYIQSHCRLENTTIKKGEIIPALTNKKGS